MAASAGFAVPVLATVGWALAAGVRLHTLWYAVYGFRFDASRVLSDATDTAPTLRAGLLVLVALGAGMLLIIGGFVVHIRGEWADDAPLTAAVAALLAIDVVGLVSGGSYWRDYLFPLLPGTALCAALLARRASRRGRAMRTVILAATASTALCLVGWAAFNVGGLQEYDEHDTGTALREVAEPDDTLVVYGGRADLQLESGLSSPYAYLWSLPMRTLDPDLSELRGAGRRRRPRRRGSSSGSASGTGTAATAPASSSWCRSATSAPAPPAATARSGCSAASTGPPPSRTATAAAASSSAPGRSALAPLATRG